MISIIVPAYNVLPYIEQCIDALMKIKCVDIEVIVVDDASTDGTYELVVKKYQHEKRITIVRNKKNMGLAAARNIGIEISTGQYIAFVDGDDYCNYATFDKAGSIIDKFHPDLIVFNFERFWCDGGIQKSGNITGVDQCKLINIEQSEFISKLYDYGQLYIWRFIVKAEIYKKNSFEVGKVYEDVRMLPRILMDAKNLFYMPRTLICYRNRAGSIVNTKSRQTIIDMLTANRLQLNLVDRFSYQTKLSLSVFSLRLYIWSCADAMNSKDRISSDELFQQYKQGVYVDMSAVIAKLKNLSRDDYIKFTIFNSSRWLLRTIFYIYRDTVVLKRIAMFIFNRFRGLTEKKEKN